MAIVMGFASILKQMHQIRIMENLSNNYIEFSCSRSPFTPVLRSRLSAAILGYGRNPLNLMWGMCIIFKR